MEEKKLTHHNRFTFIQRFPETYQQQEIIFDSNFDSGNLGKVNDFLLNNFHLWTVGDVGINETESHQKSWFHFKVSGFFPQQTVKFTIFRINMLQTVAKSSELYRPVYKMNNQKWKRLETPVQILISDNSYDILFEFCFLNSEPVSFAFSYPWSYTENQEFLTQIYEQYKFEKEFYFYKEVLVHSLEKRDVDLLTITSHEGKLQMQESKINDNLFPEINLQARAAKFRINKPVVLLTARVHPGETPGSYSMNGIIKFITDTTDARAMFLRKYFVFMIVPMLNPDGVYHGHYRMDICGQNLNRYYLNPEFEKQPTCFAIRSLVEYLNSEQRLFFYCDLHAHPGKKGCFFYGNAIDDFVMQVESQLFAKILSLNCINFEYDSCNFTKKHMNFKDRFEDMSKEGCGRVAIYKLGNIIHSYTLECGFHCNNYTVELAAASQTQKKFGTYGYYEDEEEKITSDIYLKGTPLYNTEIYENIGRCLLISILDLFEKNPFTRILNTNFKTMDALRKDVAFQVSRLDRFRKEEQKLQSKCKKITDLITEQFYNIFAQKRVFDFNKKKRKTNRVIKKIVQSKIYNKQSQDNNVKPEQIQNHLNRDQQESIQSTQFLNIKNFSKKNEKEEDLNTFRINQHLLQKLNSNYDNSMDDEFKRRLLLKYSMRSVSNNPQTVTESTTFSRGGKFLVALCKSIDKKKIANKFIFDKVNPILEKIGNKKTKNKSKKHKASNQFNDQYKKELFTNNNLYNEVPKVQTYYTTFKTLKQNDQTLSQHNLLSNYNYRDQSRHNLTNISPNFDSQMHNKPQDEFNIYKKIFNFQ